MAMFRQLRTKRASSGAVRPAFGKIQPQSVQPQAVKIAVSSRTTSRFWRVCSEKEHIPENDIAAQIFPQVGHF
jgi:hypothetical protein